MTVAVLNPGRSNRKMSALDIIMKGLDIASKFHGIEADREKLSTLQESNQMDLEDRKDAKSGFVTPKDLSALGSNFDISRTKPGDDAIELRDSKGPLYASVKKMKDPPLTRVTTQNEQGQPVQKFVKPQEGMELKAPPSSSQLAPIRSHAPDGKESVTFVEKKPGVSYPVGSKPATEGDKKTGVFASRALEALKVIDQIEAKGYDAADKMRKVRGLAIPLTGLKPAQTYDDQAYEQAQREFLAGILRYDSQGQIKDDEFEYYGDIYFPQPGQDQKIVKQKAIARERAVQDLISAAGQGYRPKDGRKFKFEGDEKNKKPQTSTPKKTLYEMSDEELDAKLKELKGGR